MTKYVCPMHPSETSDQPGSCAICGMDLEAQTTPIATPTVTSDEPAAAPTDDSQDR